MSRPIVTKEAKVFYSMIALIECAFKMQEYLLLPSVMGVHGEVKQEMKGFFNRFRIFKQTVLKGRTDSEIKEWTNDFKRDIMSYSAVFEHMADMTDEQRDYLEQLAAQIVSSKEIEAT